MACDAKIIKSSNNVITIDDIISDTGVTTVKNENQQDAGNENFDELADDAKQSLEIDR